MQSELRKLVWSSGCTNWALDPKTGMNIAMYPGYQFMFWLRSVFIPGGDFEYVDGKGGRRSLSVGGWKGVQNALTASAVLALLAAGVVRVGGLEEVRRVVGRGVEGVLKQGRDVLRR